MRTLALLFPRLLLLAALALTTPSVRAITYDAWISSFGLTGAAALTTADPDGDGLLNLIEYALDGCDPTNYRTGGTPDYTRLPALVFGLRTGDALPFVDPSVITYSSAGRPTSPTAIFHVGLRYRPRAEAENIRYVMEYSDPFGQLGRWFQGRSVTVDAANTPVAGDRIAWVLQTFTTSTMNRCFLRLRIDPLTP